MEVFLDHARRADACFGGMVVVPAGARVHGGDEHEAGRVFYRKAGAGDGDHALFEGLAQHLQHRAFEFGQLIEEEHTVMGQ